MSGMIHIRGRNFDAACVFDNTGTVYRAAPIIKWTIGLKVSQVLVAVKNKYQYARIYRDKPLVSKIS